MKTITKRIIFKIFIAIIITSPIYQGVSNNIDYCSEYIRIWGFVKYFTSYKPNAIPNLDSVFMNDIKNILSHNNKKVFNNVVKNLLEYSGKNAVTLNSVDNQLSKMIKIDTIINSFFNNRLISKTNINSLFHRSPRNENFNNPFVKNDSNNFNAVFENEKRFISPFPSVEIRLLALARYWNAVNYFYPHKNLIPINWNTVLNPVIKELISCKNEIEFHLIILHLITLLEDGHGSVHSYTLDKYYGFYQLPCVVSYINQQLFITQIHRTAINTLFKFGDIIVAINGQSFDEFYLIDSCYVWGSNSKRKKNISANNFIKSKERKIQIVRLIRNDSIIEVESPCIETSSFNDSELINYMTNQDFLIGDDFVYFDLSKIDSTEFEKRVLQSKKANIIIDLRYYPNWVLNQIANLFAIDSLPFAAYKFPDISSPSQFCIPKLLYLKPNRNTIKAHYEHIIVIVDYTTISRGEFLCMAFQSLPNVLTVGDKTAGADGNISKILLPGNISTQFTGLAILYPDGQPTQKVGVKIDLAFQKTGQDISSGQDEVLNYIKNSIIKKGK
ncbi:MAG: S41 family peptidase [Bacteroidia bacterium]|nr:S41 family peptidase [Bacteroidia bacterium]